MTDSSQLPGLLEVPDLDEALKGEIRGRIARRSR